MKIVGCDFHPSFQQIAVLDTTTGEMEQRRLCHGDGEAEQFYRELAAPALIGIEAVGNCLWFEQLLSRLGHQLWIGDAAQIRASYVRRQKTDRRDAGHILRLLVEERFPRIWVPTSEQRDVRQLLLHRHKLVQMRTRVKTELQHLALNQGMQKKPGGEAGYRGGRACGPRSSGAVADEPVRGRSDHGSGVCGDDRRCIPLQAGQAGGQLSGADSCGAQFGGQATAGLDFQAGQHVSADHAGGGCAVGLPL